MYNRGNGTNNGVFSVSQSNSIQPPNTYCIYALMSLAPAVFVWRWVPETKGKTLEEMSALWKSGGASR
ncbi:MFS transporter [Alistipes senegalensis]|uniref:MFS transporter n=1 Tax=Alistipes senegalensis TaxID=1288121 RepID=UPI00293D7492|nr:MFS transporter [Alistipes senegalensis]